VGTIHEALGIIEARLLNSHSASLEKEYCQTIGENYFRFDLPKPDPGKVKELAQEFIAVHRRQQACKFKQPGPE
jgi:hypothetical protein